MHIKTFAPLHYLVFLICSLCVLRGEFPAQDFKTIHDGVEYAQVERTLGGDPVKINLLRLHYEKVRLDVQHANDAALGLEATSSIAARKRALAAINAGFFRLDKSEFAGEAAGVLMIDGELLSESTNDRTAVFIQNLKSRTVVWFDPVRAKADVLIGGRKTGFNSFDLSGINRERKRSEALLFTPHFGPSTKTAAEGREIALSGCRFGKLRGSLRDLVCRGIENKGSAGDTIIPRDGLVISLGPDYEAPNHIVRTQLDKVGRPRTKAIKIVVRNFLSLGIGSYTIEKNIDVTNGVSRLIRDGKIDLTWEREKASRSFAESRHPRTAMARLSDGRYIMMTVDGRQPGVSVGMTLQELAEYLLSLGAVDAMNLDGGGSTTMVLDGKVVNTPSDKEGERKVGDAILVTLRGKKAARKK